MPTLEEFCFVRDLINWIDNPVIVELGAHIGEEEEWMKAVCKSRPIHIMVEPDFRNYNQFATRYARNHFRRPIFGAISDINGNKLFYPSEDTNCPSIRGSGSLHKPTKHLNRFPNIKFHEPISVPTFTLDTLFNQQLLSKIDLLWVDIQGSEKEMIAGGQNALSHTRYMFMEAECEPLYEGEAIKQELIEMLPNWTVLVDLDYNIVLRNDKFDGD